MVIDKESKDGIAINHIMKHY